jgi:hypothetical protein
MQVACQARLSPGPSDLTRLNPSKNLNAPVVRHPFGKFSAGFVNPAVQPCEPDGSATDAMERPPRSGAPCLER